MTAQVGDIITLATSITGYDTPLNGVPIFLSVNNGATIVGNPQCNVDSNYDANHYCLYKVQLPTTAGSVTATATAVGNNAGDFSNTPTATITVQNNPVPGQIVLQGTGTGIPQGMSSPFWVVLQDSSGITTPLSVSIAGSSGLSINPASGGAATCSLSSANPVCGFGVLGSTLSPSGSNDALSASESTNSYTINPLSVSVVAQQTSARTISFQNNDANTVWVGITGGTAASFLTNQMVATLNPQTSGANVTCGPSNPAAACPTGSTCRQGGANPATGTVYYCYWDQPAPSNGYAISLTSQPTTRISISESSYSPLTDITWSGNFYPRQGCTTTSGVFQCAIADCGNGTASQACAPGTGGAPGIATLPEVTLQANNNDYYDISIIGGANVKTTFGPDTSTSPPTANNYFCGTAGSSSAQGSLSAADWGMATHIKQSPVTGIAAPYSTGIQTGSAKSTAYYHYIQSPTDGRVGVGCASQADPVNYCGTLDSVPTAASNYVCGYDANAVNNGTSSDYQTSCGAHLAWLSANAIFALNASTTSNAAPFPYSTTYTTSAAGTVSLSSLYLCNNSTNQSGYAVEDASIACGCTNWGDSSLGTLSGDVTFTAPIAAPTQACSTNNLAGATNYWTTYVLPTIAWLKQSCPTCYTYPFDDMSSTFQCSNQATPSGLNSVAYLIQFNGTIPGK
jgi:carbon monoxide dehydrogenase subunit G